MISKVVIPAAGLGRRMMPLTKDKPKALIEVNGKPFLFYLLSLLQKAGFEHMLLVVGYLKEQMEEFVEKNDFPVTLVNQYGFFSEDQMGSALPVMAAQEFLEKESFVVVNSDGIFSVDDLARMRIDDNFHYVGAMQSSHPEDYGVISEDAKGFLEKIEEKPRKPKSRLVNTGLYKFTPEIFPALKAVKPSPRGEYEITDAITSLAKKRRVRVAKLKDVWVDFGRPEDMVTASEYFRKVME